MIRYRIRTGFRTAAWFPALVLAPGGIAFMVIGFQGFTESRGLSILAILLGALATVGGLLFGWIAWTGLVPASFEEYGLDDSSGIEQSRAQARARGRLEE